MLSPIEMFEINKHQIKATTNCFITLNRNEYREADFSETAKSIKVPGILAFVFPDQDGTSHLTYPYPVTLMKTDKVEDDDTVITIHYAESDIVIDQKYADNSINMSNIVAMLHGRLGYIHDPETSVLLLQKQLAGADLVHLELIIQNIMHTPEGEKCRFSGDYKNSVSLSQTAVAFDNSWLSSMSYRNIDKAINNGLTTGKNIEENPIEHIINEHYTSA